MSTRKSTSLASWWAGLSLRDSLVLLIGAIAIAWYFCCIWYVGHGGVQSADQPVASGVPKSLIISQSTFDFMSLSITTISGTLATFLGLVLGFGQVQSSRNVSAAALRAAEQPEDDSLDADSSDDSESARSPIDPRMVARQHPVGGIQRDNNDSPATRMSALRSEQLSVTWIQRMAAFAYLASLVWALWMFVGSSDSELAAVLQNLAKSTLGVIGGVLAVVLNVK